MRLLTCFKVVPDLEMLMEEDWQINDNQVDVSFVKTELNCFDESALELALRLSDASENWDNKVHLTGLSIGESQIDSYLRKLLALRFDQAVRIDTDEDLRFAPRRIAALIASYVNQDPQDVLLLGRQSSVGDNAQTPLLLAEMLDWPCITQVINVEFRFAGLFDRY